MSAREPLPMERPDPRATGPRLVREKSRSHAVLAALLGLSSLWSVLMRLLGEADLYALLGVYALVLTALLWLWRGPSLRAWLRPSYTAVSIGFGVGALMTLGTYLVFDLVCGVVPWLELRVAALYAATQTPSLAWALGWIVAIVVAEELLWRGVLLDALEQRTPRAALFWSVAIYTLAQLGSGSWLVAAAAAVCGTIWTVQRRLTQSLLSPLISHLIWTTTVIVLHPLTDAVARE